MSAPGVIEPPHLVAAPARLHVAPAPTAVAAPVEEEPAAAWAFLDRRMIRSEEEITGGIRDRVEDIGSRRAPNPVQYGSAVALLLEGTARHRLAVCAQELPNLPRDGRFPGCDRRERPIDGFPHSKRAAKRPILATAIPRGALAQRTIGLARHNSGPFRPGNHVRIGGEVVVLGRGSGVDRVREVERDVSANEIQASDGPRALRDSITLPLQRA
jgi:hypothetical protein